MTAVQSAVSQLIARGEHIACMCAIKFKGGKIKKGKGWIIISDQSLFVLEPKSKSQFLSTWRALKEIELKEKNVKIVLNSDSFAFSLEDKFEEFKQAFVQFIPQFFTSSSDLVVKGIKLPVLDGSAMPEVTRTVLLMERASQLDSSWNDRLKAVVDEKETCLDLRTSNNEWRDFILQSLALLPFVQELKLPYSDDLVDQVKECRNVAKFSLWGAVGNRFEELLDVLKEQKAIEVLSFHESNMDKQQVDMLIRILRDSRINALEFHEDAANVLDFHEFSLPENIKSLKLDGIRGLNFEAIIPCLHELVELSLVGCELEVCAALQLISTVEVCHLKYLDLSQNIASVVTEHLIFPSSLKTLLLDGVEWIHDSFLSVLKSALGSVETLSISSAKMALEDWYLSLESFSSLSSSSLRSFQWDCNPYHHNIFLFLSQCPELVSLSMCGDFHETDELGANELGSFISSCSTLENLRIDGTEDVFLGKSLSIIIEACMYHSGIQYLSLCNSSGGSPVLQALWSMMVSCTNLRCLQCDGLSPIADSYAYLQFLIDCLKAPHQILSLPKRDLEKQLQTAPDLKQDFELLKSKFRCIGSYVLRESSRLGTIPKAQTVSSASQMQTEPTETNSPSQNSSSPGVHTEQLSAPVETSKSIPLQQAIDSMRKKLIKYEFIKFRTTSFDSTLWDNLNQRESLESLATMYSTKSVLPHGP